MTSVNSANNIKQYSQSPQSVKTSGWSDWVSRFHQSEAVLHLESSDEPKVALNTCDKSVKEVDIWLISGEENSGDGR